MQIAFLSAMQIILITKNIKREKKNVVDYNNIDRISFYKSSHFEIESS